MESTYACIYDEVVSGIEHLQLAPYNLEAFKKAGVEIDKFEEGREQALVGIFKSRYLKRFESSIQAFRVSVRRALEFLRTFESYILDGRLLKSTDFHRAMQNEMLEALPDGIHSGLARANAKGAPSSIVRPRNRRAESFISGGMST